MKTIHNRTLKHGWPVITIAALLLITTSCSAQRKQKVDYPKTKQVQTKTDFHGKAIIDEYAWLDDVSNEEVTQWTKLQDDAMKAYTRSLPEYEAIKGRVAQLMNISGRSALPVQANGKLFYQTQNTEGGWILIVKDGEKGSYRELNLPFDARAAFFLMPSPDANYLALGIGGPGNYFDWKVLTVETGELSETTMRGSGMGKTRLAWTKDSNGFYYLGSTRVEQNEPRSGLRIKYHTVGTEASLDKEIYTPDSDGSIIQLDISGDGKRLVVTERNGAATAAKVFSIETASQSTQVIPLVEKPEASYIFMGSNKSNYFFQTDLAAPNGKIVSVDISKTTKVWKDVVPESNETMMGYQSAGGTFLPFVAKGNLVAPYQQDLKINLKTYDLKGKHKKTTDLPSGGLYFNSNGLNALSGHSESSQVYVGFIGITEPNTIFSIDTRSGKVHAYERASTTFNADEYVSEIAFATSKDGKKIPISMTYKKGLKKNGKNPFIMQVYGAIAFSNYPYFQGDYMAWLDMGGIHAVAHIRGGGVYGSKWHQDGIYRKKQNGIDDYISAIEWAIDQKYTSSKLMVLNGVSAGTIPIAGVLTQRPDLAGAVVSHYGMLDMIGYEGKLGADANHGYMIPEIGRASDKDDFEVLNMYSPYQKIKSDVSYPAVLAITSEVDAPLNSDSYKFIARLQNNTKSTSPMLLQMAWGSNHSAFASQTHSPIDSFADEIAFLVKALNLDTKEWLKK